MVGRHTVTRLLAAAAARDHKVFAVIDHSGEAADAGLQLRDTKLVIFGSPMATTPVMVAAPLAALDLPLNLPRLVRRRLSGEIELHRAGMLARRYGLSAEIAARLAGIDALTNAAIAR